MRKGDGEIDAQSGGGPQATEQELRDLLNAVLADNADGVLIVDAKGGRVLRANPAAHRLLGQEALVGLPFGFPVTASEPAELEVVASGEATTVEMRAATTTLNGAPVDVVTLRDVSVRKEMEDSLRRFVSKTSHEFRTPLTTIRGFAQTLLDNWGATDDEQRLRYIQIIYRQADRLARLTSELLTISRLDADAIEPQRVDVEVGRVIVDALSATGAEPDDLAIVGDTSLTVHVDPDHLQDMIVNLLTNAEKYGEPPVVIEVRETDGDAVDLTVADHGDGVPEEFVDQLFDRFTRSGVGKARDQEGTGLGLNLVLGMGERNDVRVRYEPNEPEGARFTLTIPGPRGEIEDEG